MLVLAVARGVLDILLVTAALWDIRRRRIPNALNAAILIAGLATTATSGGWSQAVSGLGAALLCLALLWFPWLSKRIGGGDVKLTSAAAAAVGLSQVHEYLLGVALGAGVLALICYGLSNARVRRQMATNMKLLTFGIVPEAPLSNGEGRVSVPFGVAAAVSALCIAWTQHGFRGWP